MTDAELEEARRYVENQLTYPLTDFCEKLLGEIDRLRKVLKKYEWVGIESGSVECLECGASAFDGDAPHHNPGCIFLTLFPDEKPSRPA